MSCYTAPPVYLFYYFLDEMQYLPKNSLSVSVLCRYEIIRLSTFYKKSVAFVKFHEINFSRKKFHTFFNR